MIFFVKSAKKAIERAALYALPSEHRKGARQNANEAEEGLKGFVDVVRNLVLDILRRHDCILNETYLWRHQHFDFSANAAHLLLHVHVESHLRYRVWTRQGSYVDQLR